MNWILLESVLPRAAASSRVTCKFVSPPPSPTNPKASTLPVAENPEASILPVAEIEVSGFVNWILLESVLPLDAASSRDVRTPVRALPLPCRKPTLTLPNIVRTFVKASSIFIFDPTCRLLSTSTFPEKTWLVVPTIYISIDKMFRLLAMYGNNERNVL